MGKNPKQGYDQDQQAILTGLRDATSGFITAFRTW
jgi:hypothetical protein